MLRASRAFILIFSFFSLQLTLMSGGERCPVVSPFGQSGTDMSGMHMADMHMADMDMADMDMAGAQGARGASGTPLSVHDEQSCESDAERTNCDSMSACVFAAVIVPVSVGNPQCLPTVQAPTLAMRTPPSERGAPDPPPPRHQS